MVLRNTLLKSFINLVSDCPGKIKYIWDFLGSIMRGSRIKKVNGKLGHSSDFMISTRIRILWNRKECNEFVWSIL
jgi:hypothetical protein